MKIAVFTDVFLEVPGGIPSSIKAQKKSLESLGHEVFVFCPGFSGSSNVSNVVLVPTHKFLRLNGAPLAKRPEKIERWLLQKYPEFGFDLVHVHYEASCSLAGMRLARKFKKPLVQTMHGREDMAIAVNVPHPFKTLVACALCHLHAKYVPHDKKVRRDKKRGERSAGHGRFSLAPTVVRAKMWELMVAHANFADQVITPSEHFAKKLVHYGVYRPITPVSNGVSDEMVQELDRKVEKEKLNLVRVKKVNEPLKIFWNSRLSREKRIMPFLKALSKMHEPYEFTACGDGNQLKRARRYARRHGLEASILGRVPHEEMLSKMLGQHLSVTVSDGFDTQGLTLLEAEATGMPVFFCDPDMKESVPAGGYVMSRGASVNAMSLALDDAARQTEKISEMSREMVKHRKEILQSAQIPKLLGVYKAVLK